MHATFLVEEVGPRPPGSPANRRATDHVRVVLEGAGLHVRRSDFTTRWWQPAPGRLSLAGGAVTVAPNPYSAPCAVTGAVVRASRIDEIPAGPGNGAVLVLDGELTHDTVMPKSFPFLDLPEQKALIARIEALGPAAVIAVSDGAPVFEDPDLRFASTTVSSTIGAGLRPGARVTLELGGTVRPGSGSTVSGRSTVSGSRVVVSAHLDSKVTTPGAFDNAGSVAVLLALVEEGLPDAPPLEVAFFNGEDHFDACGEVAWLAANDLREVTANVNLDGVGVRGRGTSVAVLGGGATLERRVDRFLSRRAGWERAAPWFESDHTIFAMRGVPALAVTSVDVHDLLTTLAHTPDDTLEVVDLDVLTDVAASLGELVAVVGAEPAPQ